MALTTDRAKSELSRSMAARSESMNVEASSPPLVALASSYSSLKLSAGFSHSVFCWRTSANETLDRDGEAVA